jgi:hypothetical protein
MANDNSNNGGTIPETKSVYNIRSSLLLLSNIQDNTGLFIKWFNNDNSKIVLS